MERNFRRALLVSGGIILGSFLIAAVAFYIVNGRLATESTKIAQARDLIHHSTHGAERLASLKNSLPAAERYERAMNLLLPTQEGLLDLPRDVETIGRLHQVGALFTFSGESDSNITDRSYLSFTITATGAGTSLLSFMQTLEVNNPRYTLLIDSFDLTGADPTAQQLLAIGRVYFKR